MQLGGAAAMFVVMFVLLNKYLPDIRLGLVGDAVAQPVTTNLARGASQIVEVAISPATQLLTKDELGRLDRNEYDIHEDLGIAVPRSKGNEWLAGEQQHLSTINLADVPAIGASLSIFRAFFEINRPVILGFQEWSGKKFSLSEKSTISGLPLSLNYFDKPEYVRAIIKAQAGAVQEMGGDPPEEVPDEVVAEIGKVMADTFRQQIASKLPVNKQVHNGLYVIPLTKAVLERNVFASTIGQANTLLDNALMYLTVSGLFVTGSLGNMFMDQRKGIASFNSNVALKNITIDGQRADAIVNNIGFIVAAKERAYFVLLTYVSTSDLQTFKELETYLNKLRFAA